MEISYGEIYGRLTLQETGIKTTKELVLCKCECGNTKMIMLGNLRQGYTKSCGCSHREAVGNNFRTHGMTQTRIYGIWSNIKVRCNNPKIRDYKYYGGKGIKYDKSWEKFENFYDDMKEGYEEHLTIDRIDSNLHYNKENCRWATMAVQNRNKACVPKINDICIGDILLIIGLARTTYYGRIRRGINKIDALGGEEILKKYGIL